MNSFCSHIWRFGENCWKNIMLYFIPTPIGNKEDITLRGLRLIKELTTFFCEDTRTFKDLCRLYDIDYTDKKLLPLTSFTDTSKLNHYTNIMQSSDCGVVSESGTPGLSDPWKSLIKACRELNIPFDVLPGANALVPTIVGSYCDTSEFTYYGFLPPKKGRKTLLTKILASEVPCVLYESVHRAEKLIKELAELDFTGNVGVFRELSKKFEQKERWTLEHIQNKFKDGSIPLKGEFVIVIQNP